MNATEHVTDRLEALYLAAKNIECPNDSPLAKARAEAHVCLYECGRIGLGPNLDAMDESDVAAVAEDAAEHRDLRNYAYAKLRAMRLQRQGNIAQALEWDSFCERLYQTLPQELKW